MQSNINIETIKDRTIVYTKLITATSIEFPYYLSLT